VVEPQRAPLVAPDTGSSPVLRDDDGGESYAPAFLKPRAPRQPAAPAAAASDDEAAKKPRRRRAPRSFEGGEGAAPEAEEV